MAVNLSNSAYDNMFIRSLATYENDFNIYLSEAKMFLTIWLLLNEHVQNCNESCHKVRITVLLLVSTLIETISKEELGDHNCHFSRLNKLSFTG